MPVNPKTLSQIEDWRTSLLDLSKRNRLISCKLGARGVLEIEHPGVDSIWEELVVRNSPMTFVWKRDLLDDEPTDEEKLSLFAEDNEESTDPKSQRSDFDRCLKSEELSDDHLLTRLPDKKLASRLSRLALLARTSMEEQGVNVLFLAFGFLRWYESQDSDIPLLAPLMLVPVALTPGPSWKIVEYEEEVIPNQCLAELLRKDFRLSLPEIPEGGFDNAEERTEYLQNITDLLASDQAFSRWEVVDKIGLGTFSFQKVAMWQDLGTNAQRIAEHLLCRNIAGERDVPVRQMPDLPSASEFDDTVHPSDTHTILDCDSSQFEAVLAASRGASLVLDGPPGTGKSQTIANIIAECLATGKTVLFVSEKAAALEVVKRRLDSQKLGDFCLECHSQKASKKQVIAELKRSLELPREQYQSQDENLQRVFLLRKSLNSYVRALHQVRGALGLTAFTVHGKLAKLRAPVPTRWITQDVMSVTWATLNEIHQGLDRLQRCSAVVNDFDVHPWKGCRVRSLSLQDQDDVRHHFGSLKSTLASLAPAREVLANYHLLDAQSGYASLRNAAEVSRSLLEYPQFPSEWFRSQPRQLAESLIEVDRLRETGEQSRRRFSQLQDAGLDQDLTEHLRALQLPPDPYLTFVKPHNAVTVKSLRMHLAYIRNGVIDLRTSLLRLNSAIDDFALAIRVPVGRESSLGVLGKLTVLGQLIADSGPMKSSWFEEPTRAELLPIVEAGCQAQKDANELKTSLAGRVTGAAFTDEGRELAAAGERFHSAWRRFWGWLGGEWGRFQFRVKKLYTDQSPKSISELFGDLAILRSYHAARTRLTEISSPHRQHLIIDRDGEIAWGGIFQGLSAIDKLKGIIRIPERLKNALTTEGAIDREEIRIASQRLAETLAEVEGKAKQIQTHYSLSRVGDRARPYSDSPSDVLDRWLENVAAALSHDVSHLERIATVLQQGADLEIREVPHFQRQLEELKALRADLTSRQNAASTEFDIPLGADWPALAELASQLVLLLRDFGEQPHSAVVKVVTQPNSRTELLAAVQDVEQFLSESGGPHWDYLSSKFSVVDRVSTGIVLEKVPLPDLQKWLQLRIDDVSRLREWSEFASIAASLEQLGAGSLVREVVKQEIPLTHVRAAFDARFFHLWLDAAYGSDERLQSFSVDSHENRIDQFRSLDKQATQATFKRIRTGLLNAADRPHSEMLNAPPTSEMGILLKEAAKKRKQASPRQLFQKIPTLLPRLKPCLMMSPLTVSQFLDSAGFRFDVVIFDEASQVRPHDAIGAIYRAEQLIVAGDQKQLPPTSFFDRVGDDADDQADDEGDEESTSLRDYESILDVCCSMGMPRKRLRWHYRSRREPLIAFSNHVFYNRELVTFPSVLDADPSTAVRFVHVPDGRWMGGTSGGFNQIEAARTAELVFQHYERHPDESLGVITFNQRQQLAVLDEIERLRRQRPEFAQFFDPSVPDPFFVKNLENVQGDERDRIILSVAYGFDAAGKFAMRFGPLNKQGGERRLNVAITRARLQVTLVSSITAHDMDPSRAKSEGARLLRAYLEYAELGPESMIRQSTESVDSESESPFEAEVERELSSHGLNVARQVGCSGFRIDLALKHPDYPGRYVLGIECDGATYHSAATARDRDRLRQEVLEGLGWRICRIWSTDWVHDPKRQIDKILRFYHERLKDFEENGDANSTVTRAAPAKDEERPILRIRNDGKGSSSVRYSDIMDVPEKVIVEKVLLLLRRYGQTAPDDLIREVAKELGFNRTAHRIKSRIHDVIESLVSGKAVFSGSDGNLSAS
jgi:very-short-patch-repair endonuclease